VSAGACSQPRNLAWSPRSSPFATMTRSTCGRMLLTARARSSSRPVIVAMPAHTWVTGTLRTSRGLVDERGGVVVAQRVERDGVGDVPGGRELLVGRQVRVALEVDDRQRVALDVDPVDRVQLVAHRSVDRPVALVGRRPWLTRRSSGSGRRRTPSPPSYGMRRMLTSEPSGATAQLPRVATIASGLPAASIASIRSGWIQSSEPHGITWVAPALVAVVPGVFVAVVPLLSSRAAGSGRSSVAKPLSVAAFAGGSRRPASSATTSACAAIPRLPRARRASSGCRRTRQSRRGDGDAEQGRSARRSRPGRAQRPCLLDEIGRVPVPVLASAVHGSRFSLPTARCFVIPA
jgi:hypothetical protein